MQAMLIFVCCVHVGERVAVVNEAALAEAFVQMLEYCAISAFACVIAVHLPFAIQEYFHMANCAAVN